MPCNLYGPNDNFHPENSHVLPGLLHRFHLAKLAKDPKVKVWGTGKAKREFLYIEDLADACVFVLENIDAEDLYSEKVSHLNIGSSEEISIADLATEIAYTVSYSGKVEFDLNKPDGTLRKVMDNSRLNNLGWKSKINLDFQDLNFILAYIGS